MDEALDISFLRSLHILNVALRKKCLNARRVTSYVGFRSIFAAFLVFNYWLRESPATAMTNHFSGVNRKQLMLLCYEICHCYLTQIHFGNDKTPRGGYLT